MSADPRLVVVIPALNEADSIGELVSSINSQGVRCLVADGGSSDRTLAQACEAGASVINSPRGRSAQMNAGAAACLQWRPAPGFLLFLHADVRLPGDASDRWLIDNLNAMLATDRRWGRFDVELTDSQGRKVPGMLRVVASMMNWRSDQTGICTGDQGLLVDAQLFQEIDGFPRIVLMEDIEISRQLKKRSGRPARLPGPLLVSGRRWQKHGVWRTIGLMWWYRLQYFFGVSPEKLHRAYYGRD